MKKILSLITLSALLLSLVLLASCGGKTEGEGSALTGKWQTKISFEKLLSNADDPTAFKDIDLSEYFLTLVFEFKASGSASASVDLKETRDAARELFGEYLDRVIESSGKSEDEVLSSMDYSSRDEALDDMVKNTDFSSFGKETVKYSYDGETLDLGGAKFKAKLKGDELIFTEALPENEKDAPYAFIENFVPLTLTREK